MVNILSKIHLPDRGTIRAMILSFATTYALLGIGPEGCENVCTCIAGDTNAAVSDTIEEE